MDVDVEGAVIGQVKPERLGLAAQVAQGCLRALFHHLAQRTGQHQGALARHAGRFDEQDLPAHRSPAQTGGDAEFLDGLGGFIQEPDGARGNRAAPAG